LALFWALLLGIGPLRPKLYSREIIVLCNIFHIYHLATRLCYVRQLQQLCRGAAGGSWHGQLRL
jgi:hypothetical protein